MSRVATPPRKRQTKPAPLREIATGPGERIEVREPPGAPAEVVRTVREFPPGTILRPRTTPARVQVIPRRPEIRCPFCDSPDVKRRHNGGGKDYFRCLRCVDETTGDFTVFVVPRA